MEDKDWLEKLKPIIDFQIENDSHYGRPAQVTLFSTDVNRLVEQAELNQYFAGNNAKLNEFLNDYAAAGDLGRDVIDVAMRIIEEQAGQTEELERELEESEKQCSFTSNEYDKLANQNKRYREALKKIAVNFPFDTREDYVKIACQALEESEWTEIQK